MFDYLASIQACDGAGRKTPPHPSAVFVSVVSFLLMQMTKPAVYILEKGREVIRDKGSHNSVWESGRKVGLKSCWQNGRSNGRKIPQMHVPTPVNPLNLNINMYILHTVFQTFSTVMMRRTC